MDSVQISEIVSSLAQHLLRNDADAEFREWASKLAEAIGCDNLSRLAEFLYELPEEPAYYTIRRYGLGTWRVACHFAVFEIIYNFGESALPFVRSVAWGRYDWPQGNAIEVLIRLAASGIETEAILAEIEIGFPQVRDETQYRVASLLYAGLKTNNELKSVSDRLLNITAFKQLYDYYTDEDARKDEFSVFNTSWYGLVVTAKRKRETHGGRQIVASLLLKRVAHSSFESFGGRVRVCITAECEFSRLRWASSIPEPVSLNEILNANQIAIGPWASMNIDAGHPIVCPDSLTKIET